MSQLRTQHRGSLEMSNPSRRGFLSAALGMGVGACALLWAGPRALGHGSLRWTDGARRLWKMRGRVRRLHRHHLYRDHDLAG